MLIASAVAILVVMAMAIIRALLGPTIYDRILAVNLFGTKTGTADRSNRFFVRSARFSGYCTGVCINQLHQHCWRAQVF